MAYNITENYKQVIYSGDSRHKIKILFNNVELQEADRYCERATIKSRILPNGAKRFSLNNFISKEVEIILHDIDTSIIQDKVSISIGTLVGNAYEYVPIGIFNIQGTPTTDKNKITIKLRDNSVKFDFNYNAKPLIDEKGGSATKLQILQDICSKAGVTCNITSFIGSTDRIGIYDNTITARQYIADLAEQAGRIATINRSGELIFVNINSLTTWNIPLSIVERYELGKAYRIGKVVYEDAIRKYETASTNYDTLYLDSSNPYISSQSQVNSILQQVNNFTIDSVKTGKILGNPAIDGYDIINIYNDKVEGNPSVFKTLATNELVYTGVLINTFDTQIGEEERKENVTITGEATFKKWATTSINNINGEIDIQAGKIDNIEKEVNPTKDTSGSSIYLEDSTNAELVNFEMEGKTTQASTPSPSSPSELVSVGTYNSITQKYDIKIETQSKNLWDNKDYYTQLTTNNYTIENNGFTFTRGSLTGERYIAKKITVKKGITYTFSAISNDWNTNFYLIIYRGNVYGTNVASSTNGKVTYTATANEDLFFTFIISSGQQNASVSNIQVEKNSQATEFEPYYYKIYTYSLNQPLRSIGDVKDLLYIKNGMLYVERKIGSVVFKGTETWNLYSSNTVRTIFYTPISQQMESYTLTTDIPKLMSSHFIPASQNATWKNGDISRRTNENNIYLIVANGYTIDTFKTWLSTHNVEVQYILASSNTEGLGKIEVPSTYKTTTYIDTVDINEPNMNITYVRDTQISNYVEEHISQIIVNEEGITQRVQTIEDSDYDEKINAIDLHQTSTDYTINAISQNVTFTEFDDDGNPTNSNINSVTTTTGFTFNEDGLNIKKSDTDYNTLIDNTGTYYKDGETIISMTNKDGFLAKDFRLQGQHYYSYNANNPSEPLASENYDFVDERIEIEVDGQTQYAYATFYNGEV